MDEIFLKFRDGASVILFLDGPMDDDDKAALHEVARVSGSDNNRSGAAFQLAADSELVRGVLLGVGVNTVADALKYGLTSVVRQLRTQGATLSADTAFKRAAHSVRTSCRVEGTLRSVGVKQNKSRHWIVNLDDDTGQSFRVTLDAKGVVASVEVRHDDDT